MKKQLLADFGTTHLGVAYRFQVAPALLGKDGIWYSTRNLPIDEELGKVKRVESRPALFILRIVKVTPKGYWVADINAHEVKWCNGTARTKYAHSTIGDARIHYDSRTQTHIQKLKNTLRCAEYNLILHRDPSLEAFKLFEIGGREY